MENPQTLAELAKSILDETNEFPAEWDFQRKWLKKVRTLCNDVIIYEGDNHEV